MGHAASRNISAPIGVTLLVAGIAILTTARIDALALAAIVPGIEQMAMSTAFCFALAGAALILDRFGSALQSILGLVLVLVPSIELIEGGSGLFSIPAVSAIGVPWHDRMVPGTAAAFLVSGLILLTRQRLTGLKAALLPQLLWLILFCISLVGCVGHLLNSALGVVLFDYGIERYAMSWPTSVGLALLSLALFFPVLKQPAVAEYYSRRQDRQITALGAALLLGVGLVSGLVGAGVLAKETLQVFQGTLAGALQANSRHFTDTVQDAADEVRHIAGLTNLGKLLEEAGRTNNYRALDRELDRIVQMQHEYGIEALWISDAGGNLVAHSGARASRPENKTRLSLSQPSWLFWQQGFRLESHVSLDGASGPIGELGVEIRLQNLSSQFDFTRQLGETGEVVACALDGEIMNCFPSRFSQRVYHVHARLNGTPLPMSFALAGQKGVTIRSDYRGAKVIAAYTPIDRLGLGMVQKVDASELYLPVRRRLFLGIGFFLALSAAGAAILFRRVRPLVSDLILAETHTRTILDNAPEAIITVDPAGRIRSFNPSAQMIFGYGEAEALELNVFALAPELADRIGDRGDRQENISNEAIEGEGRRRDGSIFPYQMEVGEFYQGDLKLYVCILRDVTERARTEAVLRELEQHKRAILNNIPDMAWLKDLSGRYLAVNAAYAAAYQRPASEIEGKTDFDLWPEEFAGKYVQADLETIRDGLTTTVDEIGTVAGGEIRWYETVKAPLRDDDGNISGTVGIARDITEQKKAHEALRQAYEEAEDLYHQAPCGYHSLDQNGYFVKINDTELSWLGYRREELVGRVRFPDLLVEKYRVDFREKFPQLMALGEISDIEFEMVRKDGTTFPALLNATAVIDEQGNFVMSRSTIYNIAERKNLELNLAKLNRFYIVLTKANEAIVRAASLEQLFQDICRIAVEDGGFHMAWIGSRNEALEEIDPIAHFGNESGYLDYLKSVGILKLAGPSGLAIERGTFQVCHDIATDPRMAPWREQALKRGYRSSAAIPFSLDGKPVGVLTLYSDSESYFADDVVNLLQQLAADISIAVQVSGEQRSRRQAEEGLRQLNQELERRVEDRTRQLREANRELEAFSYSVSHDLRAPLRSIDGFSDILQKRYMSVLDDTGRDYLSRVSRAGKRMGELIDDLLQLSRVTRTELSRNQVDLSKLAEKIVQDLQASAPGRRVQFTLQPGVGVFADERLMQVVLENLLGNAWKFTARREQARIELGTIERDGEQVVFVRDDGAGFEMRYAGKLFGAFQRLHKVDEFDGTGIGLATVQRIIHRHGGRVWGEGQVDQGACFYFTV